MKKLTFATLAAALAFATVPALAAAPNGEFNFHNADAASTIDNQVGALSAQIIQNGQFVSGNCGSVCATPDQTTTPGSRAAAVQTLLGH